MNKPLFISAAILAALATTSCGEKKQQEDIIVDKIVEKPRSEVKKVTKDTKHGSVKWISGNSYNYSISFASLDTIPAVENYGELYRDNAVNIIVSRNDGSEVCNKRITKSSFSGLLSNDMKQHGVLLNVVFDKADDNYLYFVASIGSPDETNDDFVNLAYIIDRYGDTKVATYSVRE